MHSVGSASVVGNFEKECIQRVEAMRVKDTYYDLGVPPSAFDNEAFGNMTGTDFFHYAGFIRSQY